MACLLIFEKRAILLVNVYVPSCASPFYYENCWCDLENYLLEPEVKYPKAKIILLGNFNVCIRVADATDWSEVDL